MSCKYDELLNRVSCVGQVFRRIPEDAEKGGKLRLGSDKFYAGYGYMSSIEYIPHMIYSIHNE